MHDQFVTYELRGEIALIGINRPEKRNAMYSEIFTEVGNAAERAGNEARAGVIYGHGGHFSAGLDLVETARRMAGADMSVRKLGPSASHGAFDKIARGRIPFVAALSGAVVGAGLELAAAAQVRVAAQGAYFALPEAQRGIYVGGGGSVRVQKMLGYARMADMMLTGRVLDAQEALAFNLVQYVVPEGGAMDKALALASQMTKNAPLSNWAVCNALHRTADISHDDALFVEQLAQSYVRSEESMRRLQEFADKKAAPLAIPGGNRA
jgi:(methylthio)acryloyl-CoA hydratase